MNRRRMLCAALATIAALPGIALGQAPAAFPSRAVTFIVPYSPGGLPDTVARVIGQKLTERWGQSVVVENKPGGNGVVAAQALAAKPADGYTLLVTDGSMFSINPFIYPNLPYDAQKDFTYISLTARAPLFLAVHPSTPANNFAEFVQMVKASPGKYSYGSSGIGSIHHLTFETIKSALGLDLLHVPYKGTGQSIPAVVAGDVSAVWSAMPSIAGFAKEGKLKLIAVNSEKRSGLAPNVATVAETHIPGFNFAPIIGVVGPAGLPPAIAQKISADVAEILKDKAMADRLTVLGIDAVGSDPATFSGQIMADRDRFSRAIKAADIKPN
jgi:tripartite-type tricarboxylate transporter receptor subunit TctC